MHCRLLSLRCARATELFQRRGALPVRSLRTQTICSGVIMRKKKVVVVGAGFAGVTAARTLLSESKTPIEVTVLEGSSRIGGRACTKEIEGCGKVELGATWFHGIVGNPLYEHAVHLGLMPRHKAGNTGSTWGAMKYVRQKEPSLLSKSDAIIVTKARDLYGEAVEASTESALQGNAGVVGDSVRQAFAKALKGMAQETERSKAVFIEGWAWREQLQRAMDGCHTTDDMSAHSLAHYDEYDGPSIPLPSGYQVLAEKLAEGLSIRHGTVVDQIHWGEAGVTVQCQGGEQLQADAVIVTVSLGVLKAQHRHMFQPPLPEKTVQAIDGLGFGIVDKVFVDAGASSDSSPGSAQQDFCAYGPAGGSNADQSKSGQQSNSAKVQADDSTDQSCVKSLANNEAVSYYLLWNWDPQNFQPMLLPQYGQASHTSESAELAGRAPLRDMHQMSNGIRNGQQDQKEGSLAAKGAGDKAPETHIVTETSSAQHTRSDLSTSNVVSTVSNSDGDQHVLPKWAHGAYTLRFAGSEFVQGASGSALTAANRCGVMWITGEDARGMEADSDTELHGSVTAILQQFPALEVPKQFTVHRSCWGSDPLFRGSYSYGSASATGGECDALSEPLVSQMGSVNAIRVLFAGEACHSRYFGCTHGAYLTGQSQARSLLSSWCSSSE